jgi:hypothetical protein
MQKNEKRMNILCQRLSELDPTFKPQTSKNQPLSKEELKIIEEVRRECEAQKQNFFDLIQFIKNVTSFSLQVGFAFPRLVKPTIYFSFN